MRKLFPKTKNFIVDILFPAFCQNCGKEGKYICEDCFSLIEILDRQYCPFCSPAKIVLDGKTCRNCKSKGKKLNGLYSACSYESFIARELIHQFKYNPFIKELARPLAELITAHLLNLNKISSFGDFFLVSVPLQIKKLKSRGYNPAEELAKHLSEKLKIPLFSDVLFKTKQTAAQVELKEKQRRENLIGAFSCKNPELVRRRKILLVDDVLTTGSTLEECAKALKAAGAKEVWGIVVARG